jgi:hypothetical protein
VTHYGGDFSCNYFVGCDLYACIGYVMYPDCPLHSALRLFGGFARPLDQKWSYSIT